MTYEFDERHLAGILANKADETLKEKLDLVDHLCENTFQTVPNPNPNCMQQ